MDTAFEASVQIILDSKRLTFEDETAIRHKMGVRKPKLCTAFVGQTIATTTLIATGSGLLYYPNSFPMPTITRKGPEFIGKLLVAIGGVGACGILARETLRCCLNLEIKRFLDLLLETSNLSKKAIRWILDNEVLQRGYSVVTAMRDSSSRGNVLSLKACLRLRRSAFIESRCMVFILRAVAVDLLQSLSADKSLDSWENHICLIPLQEFGDSLSISESDLEALYLSTDGFSLQATKSLTGLLDLQVSEFLKLLCWQRLGNLGFWRDFVLLRRSKTASMLFLEALQRMDLEYKFETDEPLSGAYSSLERQPSVSEHIQPPDYCRSLDLHLTAALKDLRFIIMDSSQAPEELEKIAQQDRLEKLGYHVKCCMMLLEHLRRKSLCVPAQTPSTDNPDVSPTASDFELRLVVTENDRLPIQDDIFEALVMNDAEAVHRGEPAFSEINHWQEQKQQSKMVLDEIKSLLVTRSADWDERERKVRERKRMPLYSNETDAVVPEAVNGNHEDLPSESASSPCPPNPVWNGPDLANVAAALGTQWQHRAEDKFGSDESSSEAE